MAIGSVRPMIGKGPIGLWGLSKGFIATISGLIGVIDRLGSRIVASGLCGWRVSLLCSSRAECKKEHRRSPFTNALPSNDDGPLEVPAAQNPNRMASSIYESSRGCIWRKVEGAYFASASPFVGLALPILSAHHSMYHLQKECRHPFRKTSAIHRYERHERYFSRYLWGLLHDGRLTKGSGTVMSSSCSSSSVKWLM